MMDRKSLLAVASIGLAVVVPLLMAFQSSSDLANNPIIKVRITGYDPRDILHGHYMQFQYAWNWDENAPAYHDDHTHGTQACLCVEPKEIDPKVRLMDCKAAKTDASCAHLIKGDSWGADNFTGPPSEYYVDENIALPLEKFFRESDKTDFRIGLSLPPSGRAKIEKLYIDGKTLEDYIAEHGAQFTVPEEAPVETPAE